MSEPDIVIDWLDGLCPVQAEGTIDGEPFYFRARWSHWAVSVGGEDVVMRPSWRHEELYADERFAAGYMSHDEVRAFIVKAARAYAARASQQAIGS